MLYHLSYIGFFSLLPQRERISFINFMVECQENGFNVFVFLTHQTIALFTNHGIA